MTAPLRRLTDQQLGLLDKLRTVFPPVAGFLASNIAVWAVRKGIPLTEGQALTAITTLGVALGKVIAAYVNPSDAAAPSLVKMAPDKPYQGEVEKVNIPAPTELELPPPPPRPPEARLGTWTVSPVVDGPAITTNEPYVEDFRPPAVPLPAPPAFERGMPEARSVIDPFIGAATYEPPLSDRRRAVPEVPPADAPAKPPKKKRAPRRKAVTPPTPGAPQPVTPVEPSEGFEP